MSPPRAALMILAGLFLSSMPAAAQTWQTYESNELAIRFQLPGTWKTAKGRTKAVPYMSAESPDRTMSLVVSFYGNTTQPLDQLLSRSVRSLQLTLDGSPTHETVHRLDAWIGEATGTLGGVPVGVLIMAARDGPRSYVAYISTPADLFKQNSAIMNTVLDSFAPLIR